ncbi:hypothetical protein SBV1_1200007 [Verrucomicrobia bacterium]|nr:hypothetical protein SBV1_1200007 [Verrucomicrobiota bacterium]
MGGIASFAMKVLLRHRQIGLYYAGCRRWVSDPAEALAFEGVERAARLSQRKDLPGTEVVLREIDPLLEHARPVNRPHLSL